MRTAMIDVGIDQGTIEALKHKTNFLEVRDNIVCTLDREPLESLGMSHGGHCLAYFEAGAHKPADNFILLKQDECGKSNVDDLVTALEWCVENDISLISLSMGTTEWRDAKKLADVAERILQKGIIFVAGAANDRSLTYPACFINCIGVCVDYTGTMEQGCFSYAERVFDGIEIIVSPFTEKGEPIGSNSTATAYFAGVLARSLQGYNGDIRVWLKDSSVEFPARCTYSYARNGIMRQYTDDVIVVACYDFRKQEMFDYCLQLQAIFLRKDYYCLSIHSGYNKFNKENFPEAVHVHSGSISCSYGEYVELLIQLCRPNIVLVEKEYFDGQSGVDVILLTSSINAPYEQEGVLAVFTDQSEPQETAEKIIEYFG